MRAKWAAMLTFENPINSLSAIGLALGALCGMAGTFVAHPHIQALLWAIDGAAALVMAAALLTLKHFRKEGTLWPQPADAIECWEALRTEGRGWSSRSDPVARFYAADRAVIGPPPGGYSSTVRFRLAARRSVLWLGHPRLVQPGGDVVRGRPALCRIRCGRRLERLLMHRAVRH